MSNQRKLLKNHEGAKLHYRATFDSIQHKGKHHTQPVILLKNIVQMQDGRPIDAHLAVDHMWVNLTSRILKEFDYEVFDGDWIEFDAVITSYPISRHDTIAKRQRIWDQRNDALNKLQVKIDKLYANNQDVYLDYQEQMSTYDEMKHLQSQNQIKIEELRHLKDQIGTVAHEKIQSISLVDYSFKNISSVKVQESETRDGWNRIRYNINRFNSPEFNERLKYTKFLAARTLVYRNGDDWADNRE